MGIRFIAMLGIVLFGVHTPCLSLDKGQPQPIQQSDPWKKLLHYEDQGHQTYKSQIQSPQFFIDAQGSSNPSAELKANIERMKLDPNYACLFPARAEFLRNYEGIEGATQTCPELEGWKSKLRGGNVSFVFVTQYISNPASIFGHSFVLFKKEGLPLYLSPTVSNAAVIPEDISAWDYAVGGLGGKFPSDFSAEPLYFKIQEYNNIENRDLWIYQLQLSTEQIETFLNHLWELSRHTTEGYRFLTKNCSVNAYNALAAIHPDLELIPSGKLYVTPLETMKNLRELIVSTTYIPSNRERLAKAYSAAPEPSKQSLDLMIKGQKNLLLEKDPDLASFSLDYFEYLKSQQGGKLNEKQEQLYLDLLKSRASLGSTKLQEQAPTGLDPLDSFSTWRLGLNLLRDSRSSLASVSFSPLYHSLVQHQAGFLPNSELIIADFEWVLEAQRKDFKKVTAFQWANHPESNFDSQISWQAKLIFNKIDSCDHCYLTSAQVDFGKTWAIKNQHRVYLLAGAQSHADPVIKPEIILGSIAEWQKFKVDLRISEIFMFRNNFASQRTSTYFAGRLNYLLKKNWDLNASLDSNLEDEDNLGISVNYFF